jgi:hypothetical protein
MTEDKEIAELKAEEKEAQNKRLETIGWALFLIMIGGLALVPDNLVPEGSWLIGVGLIMLGLNVARYRSGIKMSGFTLALGAIAILSGLGDMLGIDVPVFAILLILVGAYIIIRPMLEKNET